jgi:predicted nucleotidyltransferase component of viral defense system
MEISIYNQLKKKLHRDVGFLQDEVVELLYDIFPEIIFHGGTSIWRCYKGNRFSEDLDFYLLREENIKQKLIFLLSKKDLQLIKYKETENLIFSKITSNNIIIQLEIRLLLKEDLIFKKSTPIEYRKIDGSTITVLSLTEKELLFEKAKAYHNRKLIRDIYDVYFFSNFVSLTIKEKKELEEIILNFKEPIDSENLKAIVYKGAIPNYSQMLDFIKKRYL